MTVSSDSSTLNRSEQNRYVRMALHAGGIMVSLVLYGLLQERIMKQPYFDITDISKTNPILFRSSAYLVLNNRVIAILFAVIMMWLRSEDMRNRAPIYKFAAVSVSNTIATFCQYEALKYVSFPTQTLGKCGKIIPVMILGMSISGKKYSWKEFLIAFVVSLGCALFVLTGDVSDQKEKNDTIYGLLLMVLYLFSDGFTSTLQEKLLRGTDMSTYNQMLYVNLCSAFFSIASLVFTNELVSSFEFSFTHTDFLMNSLFLSLTSTAGQVVILLTIKEFGALFFATVMTVRQVISILLSCLIYLHPLSIGQWISAAVVFGAIYYKDTVMRAGHSHGHSQSSSQTQNQHKDEVLIPLEEIHKNNPGRQLFGAKA